MAERTWSGVLTAGWTDPSTAPQPRSSLCQLGFAVQCFSPVYTLCESTWYMNDGRANSASHPTRAHRNMDPLKSLVRALALCMVNLDLLHDILTRYHVDLTRRRAQYIDPFILFNTTLLLLDDVPPEQDSLELE
jgi:hypothetical protein